MVPSSVPAAILGPWALSEDPLPPTSTTAKHNAFQNHHKMIWTSQNQAAPPAPCCRSFTLSHEMFVSSTPHVRGGGCYSPPSTTTPVLTPGYKFITGRACLLLKPSGQFIVTYVSSGVTHKLSLPCAINSPPPTIHGGHLNQLVSSHSRLINKATSATQLVAVIYQGVWGIHPLWVT